MDDLEPDHTGFLTALFREGRVVVPLGGEPTPIPSPRALRRLEAAYEAYRLELAGPPLELVPEIAFEAAELVRLACRALVSRVDRAADLAKQLRMSRRPSRPAEHLSADLLLRYLPQVHQRARAIDPADPLVAILADVLRQWPLSGVLAELDDDPIAPFDPGDHLGVAMIYAERFARSRRKRPAWQPIGRTGTDVLELVLDGQGR